MRLCTEVRPYLFHPRLKIPLRLLPTMTNGLRPTWKLRASKSNSGQVSALQCMDCKNHSPHTDLFLTPARS